MAKTKAKPRKRGSLASRYRQQVNTEAQLRFAPQRRQLRQAVSDIATTLAGDVNAARGAAVGVQRSAAAARPVLAKSNADAVSTVNAAQDELLGKLPGALGTTPALSAAAARDAAGTNRRLAEALNNSQSELTSRATDAAAGAAYAESNARATAKKEGLKLRDQLQGVASDAGAFKQGRLGQLTESARGRSVTRRGQDTSAATTRRGQNKTAASQQETRDAQYLQKFGITYDKFKGLAPGQRRALIKRANAKAGTGPGGAKPATPVKRQEISDGIGLARSQAKRLKAAGRLRPEAATLLLEGRPSQTITDPKTGQKLKAPGVKAVKQLYASVALDIAYDGTVSHKNAVELHKLGVSLKDLGLPTAPRTSRRQSGRPTKTQSGTLQPRA